MQRKVPGAEPEALRQVSRRLGEQETAALDLHQALSPGGVPVETEGAWGQRAPRAEGGGPHPGERGGARAPCPLQGRSSASQGNHIWLDPHRGQILCILDTRSPSSKSENTPGLALTKIIYSTTLPSSGVGWESSMCTELPSPLTLLSSTRWEVDPQERGYSPHSSTLHKG